MDADPLVDAGTDPPVVVDARGKRCPVPVIMLARAARQVGAATRIDVLTTDPAAGPDIVAWCRMRGHTLLEQRPLTGPGELCSAVQINAVRIDAGQVSGAPGEPPTRPPPAAQEPAG